MRPVSIAFNLRAFDGFRVELQGTFPDEMMGGESDPLIATVHEVYESLLVAVNANDDDDVDGEAMLATFSHILAALATAAEGTSIAILQDDMAARFTRLPDED